MVRLRCLLSWRYGLEAPRRTNPQARWTRERTRCTQTGAKKHGSQQRDRIYLEISRNFRAISFKLHRKAGEKRAKRDNFIPEKGRLMSLFAVLPQLLACRFRAEEAWDGQDMVNLTHSKRMAARGRFRQFLANSGLDLGKLFRISLVGSFRLVREGVLAETFSKISTEIPQDFRKSSLTQCFRQQWVELLPKLPCKLQHLASRFGNQCKRRSWWKLTAAGSLAVSKLSV